MSDIQRLIFEMNERPQDFVLRDNDILIHKPSEQQIWVYLRDYRLYRPYRIDFTFLDRRRFGIAFGRWRRACRAEQRHWLRNWLCEQTTEPMKATVRG